MLEWHEDTHLKDNFAPIAEEVTETELAVEGALPPLLDGLYVRNGPNPHTGHSGHWFLGDGMLHGVRIGGGKAHWYKARYVRTGQLEGRRYVRPDLTFDYSVGPGNTHIVEHGGRILALAESSYPTLVDPDLGTLGTHDFGGRLNTAFTAHPKICPRTGDMHAFGYSIKKPYLTYHRVDASGQLVRSIPIEAKGPSMMHDFALTEHYAIFFDLSVVFEPSMALSGTMPFRWNDQYGARVGLMPLGEEAPQVKWIEIEPCYIFHVANAYERADGTIRLEAARYADLWRDVSYGFTQSNFQRYEIDPVQGTVRETVLDDAPMEFPRIDERRTGQQHRITYGASARPGEREFSRIVKYDLATGEKTAYEAQADASVGEFVFVPADSRCGEDEGWLVGFEHSARGGQAVLTVLDAQDPGQAPVARVPLGHRVPYGFHGSFIPADRMAQA